MPDLLSHLSATRRHALLALGASLAARRSRRLSAGDRALLLACGEFDRLERLRLGLLDGPDRIADDAERDAQLVPIEAEQRPVLDAVCAARASSLVAHRARAASFVLWDGGEVTRRAAENGFLEDRLLAAMLRDLVGRGGAG